MSTRVVLLALCLILLAGTCFAAANSFSALDFGAKGDGVADDTAAIQKALDAAGKVGGVANLPAGSYLITDSLKVPGRVTLQSDSVRWENSSTVIVVKKNGFAAIRLVGPNATVKGLFMSYPENTNMVSPTKYPPAIQLESINPSVENIHFAHAWDGICTPENGANAGQALIKDITGFIHNVGIRLDGPLDVVRIQNVHWFVAGGSGQGVPYYRRNRVGFQFGRVDGVLMSQCFIIGAKSFFEQLGKNAAGKPVGSLGLQVTQCWVEAVKYGFLIEGTCGFTLSDSNILVTLPDGCGVQMTMPSLYYNSVISNTQIRYAYDGSGPGVIYAPTAPHGRNRLGIVNCQIDVPKGGAGVQVGPLAQRISISDSHIIARPAAIIIDKGADMISIRGNILNGAIQDNSGAEAKKVIEENIME